jgi:hypothetical protein
MVFTTESNPECVVLQRVCYGPKISAPGKNVLPFVNWHPPPWIFSRGGIRLLHNDFPIMRDGELRCGAMRFGVGNRVSSAALPGWGEESQDPSEVGWAPRLPSSSRARGAS